VGGHVEVPSYDEWDGELAEESEELLELDHVVACESGAVIKISGDEAHIQSFEPN